MNPVEIHKWAPSQGGYALEPEFLADFHQWVVCPVPQNQGVEIFALVRKADGFMTLVEYNRVRFLRGNESVLAVGRLT